MTERGRVIAMAKGPLNKGHLNAINESLRRVQETIPLIEAAERCGIDCIQHKEDCNYLVEQLSALKAHFFPQGGTSG